MAHCRSRICMKYKRRWTSCSARAAWKWCRRRKLGSFRTSEGRIAPSTSHSLACRCTKCFVCPLCETLLQTSTVSSSSGSTSTFHGASEPVEGASDRSFFSCSFCKWESVNCGWHAEDASSLVLNSLKRERNDDLMQVPLLALTFALCYVALILTALDICRTS
eukprot:766531-Hanusia_phi.AAC.4